MKIAAIPTKYAGVQFRSRLEARWAAFFDLLKWTWEYEPIDLDGYIPDFCIKDRFLGSIFVEVKPARIDEDVGDVVSKALDAGCDRIVVVGLDFREYQDGFTDGGDVSIGRVAGRGWMRPFDLWLDEDLMMPVFGDKDSCGEVNAKAVAQAHRLWRSAQNKVQWKGAKATPEKPRERRVRISHPFGPYRPMPDPVAPAPDSEVVPASEIAAFFAAISRSTP